MGRLVFWTHRRRKLRDSIPNDRIIRIFDYTTYYVPLTLYLLTFCVCILRSRRGVTGRVNIGAKLGAPTLGLCKELVA
jgi:hypothetical protein